jgi:FkbM family methyltransferase
VKNFFRKLLADAILESIEQKLNAIKSKLSGEFDDKFRLVEQKLNTFEKKLYQEFHDKIESLGQKINTVEKELPEKFHGKFGSIEQKLNATEKKLYQELIRKIPWNSFIPPTKIPYPEFKEYFSRPDFPDKFFALVNGLDASSRSVVVALLFRLRRSLEAARPAWDIYTDAEKNLLGDMWDNFFGQTLKLSDNMYVYKNYVLTKPDFDAGVFLFRYGLGDIADINYTKDKNIIDVGGYIGDSALLFSPLASKTVYTFEASSSNFQYIAITIALNGIINFHAEHLALGDRQGEITIRGRADQMPATTARETMCCLPDSRMTHLEFEETVKMDTLDAYVEKHKLDIGLIKVDIEGGEQSFLRGAVNVIHSQKPILLVSIYHYADGFFDIKPMIENWNLGYRFKIVPGSKNILSGMLLIVEVRAD